MHYGKADTEASVHGAENPGRVPFIPKHRPSANSSAACKSGLTRRQGLRMGCKRAHPCTHVPLRHGAPTRVHLSPTTQHALKSAPITRLAPRMCYRRVVGARQHAPGREPMRRVQRGATGSGRAPEPPPLGARRAACRPFAGPLLSARTRITSPSTRIVVTCVAPSSCRHVDTSTRSLTTFTSCAKRQHTFPYPAFTSPDSLHFYSITHWPRYLYLHNI